MSPPVTQGMWGTMAVPPLAGTHPVSSMMQPSHESGHRQSPGRRGDGLGVPAVRLPAWCPRSVPIPLPWGWQVPAAVRCLFHIMPTFCPSVCASVTAMAATLPYCTGGTGESPEGPPHSQPALMGALTPLTSLTPPARAGEQMPPTKAVPLRLL